MDKFAIRKNITKKPVEEICVEPIIAEPVKEIETPKELKQELPQEIRATILKKHPELVRYPATDAHFTQYVSHTAIYQQKAREFLAGPYPDTYSGRGIVCCAGGDKYLPCAWVNINMLRKLGCTLPIQVWHFGEKEVPEHIKPPFVKLGVQFVDILKIKKKHPMENLRGWEAKPYSIIHSSFEEVLCLDADNNPVRDPSFLFECKEYKQFGCMFWPDFGRLGKDRLVWEICEVEYKDEPEFESGQIVVDKSRCWDALMLTLHYNKNSPFYYLYMHGDKETFHMAWRKTNTPYFMAPKMHAIPMTMVQKDPKGEILFQHRNTAKWKIGQHVEGFLLEDECMGFLKEYPTT